MRRRELFALVAGSAFVWPLAAIAQQKVMPLIGWLGLGRSDGPETLRLLSAFRQGLSDERYIDGKNIRFDYRWAEGDDGRLPTLAAGLVADKVDVIIAAGSLPQALAAKAATAAIPIVFVTGADPVAEGLVANLARPSGNLTGVAVEQIELSGKRVELLSELVPQAKTIALLVDPTYGATKPAERWIVGWRQAASARGLQLREVSAGNEGEFGAAFARLARSPARALVVAPYPNFWGWRKQIATLAGRYKVPAIYPDRVFVTSGGLFSYGPSVTAMLRLAGRYAGRILKGARPADLPVEQPTKFELVINLKTAKALGRTVPQSILARADEVVE